MTDATIIKPIPIIAIKLKCSPKIKKDKIDARAGLMKKTVEAVMAEVYFMAVKYER